MRNRTHITLAMIAAAALLTPASAQQSAAAPRREVQTVVGVRKSSPWWLEISLKASSVLVDPADEATLHEVPTPESPMGVISPDGRRIAFVGSDPHRVQAGHDFDLFVADVDANQPSGKANVRMLTTDQPKPGNVMWLPDSNGLAFQAISDLTSEIWYVGIAPGSQPVRVSDEGKRCLHLGVTPANEIAWVQVNRTQTKQQFDDLIVQRPPMSGRQDGARRTVLHDQFISAFAFSPDGKTLAWSEPGTLRIVNLEAGDAREVPCHGIHRQLINHMANDLVWSPDGKLIAATFSFAGGIARAFNGDPNAPWPRMFAEDKVFFIPASWTPTAESLKVGEGADYPSPTADDPKAEISPPAGDRSTPWWVRELPMRPLGMKWISAAEAHARTGQSE